MTSVYSICYNKSTDIIAKNGGVFILNEAGPLPEKDILEELKTDRIVFRSHRGMHLTALHNHSFLELTYVLSGAAEHELDGQVSVLHAGDWLIVDHGSRHAYRARTREGFDNLDCLFLPEFLDPALKGTKSLRSVLEHYLLHFNPCLLVRNPARMVFHDGSGEIRDLLERMRRESQERLPGYSGLMRCYLIEILLLALRGLEGAPEASEGADVSAAVIAYIEAHSGEQVTLTDLASKFNYSLPYLSRLFREQTGVSFVRYLQNYRVMQGCRLLSETAMTLSEVAETVGYRDVKFFGELVRKLTGLTPREFRRKNAR